MKIALIQLNAGTDKKKNIAQAVEMVQEAAAHGAKFVALPEVFNYRGPMSYLALAGGVAEKIPGDSLKPLMALAQEKKIFILAGSIYERIRGEKKVYNTSVLVGPQGSVNACYRKMHLFDANVHGKAICESKYFRPGTKPIVAQVEKFKAGLSICYDLRFPELFRSYGSQGCDILCVPSSFTQKTGQAHWEVLLRARAIENLSYVLAPNQVGQDGRGVASFGTSLVVSPWGKVIAKASAKKEEILYARIELSQIRQARKILPSICL
ncbi:MAG: carbon-nitrogen hydrolase family protein [Candidatus Omnitrophica bacterium]|nr:carbon-nitrogen hydrolase family protein [Candidatus Omnitrophota bacterium]